MGDRGRTTDGAALAGLVGLLVAGNLWWIHRHRTALAVDLDEATLLVRAEHLRTAASAGPGSFWTALTDHQTSAPLLSVATAATTTMFGRSPVAVALPEVAALVVLLVSTWWACRQLGGGRWALLATALVGVAPGVVLFTRVHHQIIPGAAALALCVAVGLRTDALRDRRWSVLLGVAVGVALLTRAMLVFSAPLAILAWLVALAGRRRIEREQWVNGGIALGVAAVVALPWWAFTAGEVVRYLLDGAGGGADAPSVLHVPSPELRLAGRVLGGLEDHSLAWACIGVLAVGLAVALVRAVARRGPGLQVRELYVLAVVAVTFVALIVSADDFPGYFTLVVPLLVAWGVARAAREPGALRWLVLGPVIGLTAIGAVMFPMGASSGWHLPGFWVLSERTDDTIAAPWADTYRWIVDTSTGLGDPGCPTSMVVVQADHRVTADELQWAADVLEPREAVRAVATATKVTPTSVRTGISQAADSRSLLVLVDPTEESGFAPLSADDIEREARAGGFRPRAHRTMPNGVTVSLWELGGPKRRCS